MCACYALASALAILAFSPWLPIALRQIRTWPAQAEGYALAPALLDVARWLVVGRTLPLASAAFPLTLTGMLLLMGLLAVLRSASPISRLWALWLAVPIALLFAFSLYREAYLKVMLMGVPPLCLLVAQGVYLAATRFSMLLSAPRPRIRLVSTALCAGLMLASVQPSLANLYFNPAYARDDYRGIATLVNADHRTTDAVLFIAPNQWEVFTYYQKDASNTFPLGYQPRDKATADAELAKVVAVPSHPRLFALYYAEGAADPEGWYERWLAENTFKSSEQWVGNIRVAVYGADASRLAPAADALRGGRITFGSAIQLTDVSLQSGLFRLGDVIPLQLTFVARTRPVSRLKVFVHIGLANAPPVASFDMEPVAGLKPIDSWQPGEPVLHNHGAWLKPGTLPGDYGVYIGLYDSATGERLKILGAPAPDDRLLIGSVSVRP